jgi:tetratricopeptide (TPR) repeat protein
VRVAEVRVLVRAFAAVSMPQLSIERCPVSDSRSGPATMKLFTRWPRAHLVVSGRDHQCAVTRRGGAPPGIGSASRGGARASACRPATPRHAQPAYATILDALANVHWELGERREAEPLYAQARAIYEASSGAYAIRHAYALFKLARLLDDRGEAAGAEALYQRATERFETICTGLPREFAGFLLELARIRRGQQRHDDAIGLLERALAVNPHTSCALDERALILLEMAECLAARGDRPAAQEYFDRAVAAHEESFGGEHPNLGRALHLRAAFRLDGDPTSADAASEVSRALGILSDSLGGEHSWTREARATADHRH